MTSASGVEPIRVLLSVSRHRCTKLPVRFAAIGVSLMLLIMGLSGWLIATTPVFALEQLARGQAEAGTLASITINRQNIFEEDNKPGHRLINQLHVVTLEKVISREVWLRPGDKISAADVAEIERNLRRLDLFASVRVFLQSNPAQPGAVDLIIDTADRLSIVAGAGGSFLGGIGEVSFSIGENNLLGLGHQLQFGYSENTEGELLGSVAYENVLLGSDDIYAGIRTGQTEEGDFAVFTLTNRFLNFNDDRFWQIEIERESRRDDIFESGESVAEVPRLDEQLSVQWQQRYGVPARLLRTGPVLDINQTRYEPPIGPQADTIERPEDLNSVFAGAFIAIDSNRDFRSLTGLDTLRFEQDIALGYSAQLLVGLEHRKTESTTDTAPVFFLRGWSTNAVSDYSFFNIALDSSAGIDSDSLSRWSVSMASTVFNTRLANQVFGARMRYRSAFDRDGLPPQQTLGEVRGLRGFPARAFNGEQSLLVNLEHRWRTPLSFASVELGTVAFLDSGWVGDRGSDEWLEQAQTAIGVGLRIGSPQLLGSGVIRVDLAFPVGSAADVFDPTISLAVGQVFGFRP